MILKKCLAAALVVSCSLAMKRAAAYPSAEKAALSLGSVTSQATDLFLDDDGRFLYIAFGNNILRMDTETWDLADDQIPALEDNTEDDGEDLSGDVKGIRGRGDFLYATQNDGDLITVDLGDITADPSTDTVIDGTLGTVAADTESGSGDAKLYFLDASNGALIIHDLESESNTAIPLTDDAGQKVTPVAMALVGFPTSASTATGDQVFITTNNGLVLVVAEGAVDVGARIELSETNKDLPHLAVSPNGSFVFVVNATDGTVHVIDTSTDTEVDMDATESGVNPVTLDGNSSLTHVVLAEVENPTDTYAFVSGSGGLSVIDLEMTATAVTVNEIIDLNDEGDDDETDDPISMTSAPGLVVASESSDGYLYSTNGNATISVVTENPFIDISATSLADAALSTTGSFTVTFQSDEAGTYSVKVGGDLTGSGTEVTSGTVDAAATDVVTSEVAYDSSIFSEGENRVFVFVTDGDGFVGRDAVDITVDTPPGGIEITETGFGNKKIEVTFNRLTATDIDHYNVYVDTDATVVTTSTTVATTVSQPASGDTVTATVEDLVNNLTYYIAVEGVDASGNVGVRSSTLTDGSLAYAVPERTEGLAGRTGEAGCTLDPGREDSLFGVLYLLCALIPVLSFKCRKVFLWSLFFLGALLPFSAGAMEKTPQWWSLEFKGGVWMPLDATTRNSLGRLSPFGLAEFGFLYHGRYGAEVGVGYVGASGTAVGAASGRASSDSFDFTMIPIQNSFTFRADFKEDQFLVPYAKAGLDYVIFRENVQGTVTKGVKLGVHVAAGLQINMNRVEDLSELMETSLRINDIYLVVEARYASVNGFGGGGVDLSNLMFSSGFLFEF